MNRIVRPIAGIGLTLVVGVSTITLGVAASPSVYASSQKVVVKGAQLDYGDRTNRNPGSPFGGPAYSIDDLCNVSGIIGSAAGTIVSEIERAAVEAQAPVTIGTVEMLPGAPTRQSVSEDLRTVRDEVCARQITDVAWQRFEISYSSCRMIMVTPANEMLINLPAGGGAEMWMLDKATNEIVTVELTSAMGDMPDIVGKGWSEQIQLETAGDSKIFEIGPEDDAKEYEAEHYTFEYTSGLGKSGVGALGQSDVESGNISMDTLGNLVTVESSGDAWISDSVPGIDIVKSFYENFTSTVQADQAPSFLSGIIQNAVVMLEHGMPLQMDQTVSSKVMGRTSVSGASEMLVGNIELVDMGDDWCSLEMQVPENYTVTDINQQISNAMSGVSMSEEDAEQMNEAMNEAAVAMQNMSSEQQAMMESMGLGDMMNQMMGGAASGGQQAAGASAAGAGSAAVAAKSGSAMPPASELQGDSVTESVQKHLQALGYDVGSADGEMSMETTIAISTFQAEKGMEVTGEVSPQLLGVLSAEVDSRR